MKRTALARRLPDKKRPAAFKALKGQIAVMEATLEPERIRLAAAKRRRQFGLQSRGMVDE
jgi:hypothetical protein